MNIGISMKEFKKEVLESMHLSLVQFKTEWNGACQIIAPVYEELAKSYTRNANFFTVDSEEDGLAVQQLGVVETPAILFFKNGRVIDYVIGLVPKNILITKIENALSQIEN